MSLVIPGYGRTITFKPRRPSPKTKVSRRGGGTANSSFAGNKRRLLDHISNQSAQPKSGSKPRGGKVTPVRGAVDNKPKPKLGSKPRRKVAPVRGAVDNKPKPRPARAKASGKRYGGRPMSSAPRRPRGCR